MAGENPLHKGSIGNQAGSIEKRIFWNYARRRLEEMRLLFRGGRLSRKEGYWNNVINHCLVQGAEVDAFVDLLHMETAEGEAVQKVAFVHDWKKRLEIKPEDFTPEQIAAAEELLERVSPDPDILDATEAGFPKKIIDGEASFLQRLMFYIDDITSGSEIVGYRRRIDETEQRTPYNEDPELTRKLGGRFWDVERRACHQVEQELFALLQARGVEIHLPQDIPSLIQKHVMEKTHFTKKTIEEKETTFPVEIFAAAQAEAQAGRQNEDTFVAIDDEDVLVLGALDGATSIPEVTGVKDVRQQNGRFAAQVAAVGIEKNYQRFTSAAELLLVGNQQIADTLLSLGTNPNESSPEDLSNAQAVLVLIKKKEGVVEIAQIGDAVCLIEFRDGNIELAMPPDITPQDNEALKLGQKISRERNVAFKEAVTSEAIHRLLVQGRQLCNKEDKTGVGVLNGQQTAQLYLKTRQLQLSDVTRIILLTDGFFPPQEEIGAEPDWTGIAATISRTGVKGLYQEVLTMKNSDPEFKKYPRFKTHDDATAIVVHCSK